MTRLLFPLGLVCLLLGGGLLRADDPVALRWQLRKGQVLAYLLRHHEVRTVRLGDEKFETTTDTEYDWQWTVQEVDERGTATLELKLKGLRVTSSGKDYAFSYDSRKANEGNDEFNKNLVKFYDQLRFGAYRLRLEPGGRITEVYGLDKLLGETTAGTHVAEFNGLNLHDDTFAWFLQLCLGALPDKPATQGASWKAPLPAKLNGVGGLSGQVSVTLDKAVNVGDRPCRQLRLDGSETLELDMPWANAMLRGPLKTSKLEATIQFDPQAGMVRKSEAKANYAGELKLSLTDPPLVLKVDFQQVLELEAKP
jgi:hypothetical protein